MVVLVVVAVVAVVVEEVVAVSVDEVLVVVVEVAEVVVEGHLEDLEASKAVKKLLLSLIVMPECLLPVAKKMHLSQKT